MQDNNIQPISLSTSPLIEATVQESAHKQITMQPALHISTQVLPEQKIEIYSPDLLVGDAVDVFIIASETTDRSCKSMINQLKRVCSCNEKSYTGQHLFSKPSISNIQSDITVAIEALQAIDDYLSPEPGSLCEEMLNDALEGRMRLEATDIQDRMLIKHHAKKYLQQAIATLQRLNS